MSDDGSKDHPWRREGDMLLLYFDNRIESLRKEIVGKLNEVDKKAQHHETQLTNGIKQRLGHIDEQLRSQGEALGKLKEQMGATVSYKALGAVGAVAAAIASAVFAGLNILAGLL